VAERQHQATGVSSVRVYPVGGPVVASCAMIMANLQNYHLCLLAVLSHHIPRFSFMSSPSSAGISHSCVVSRIQFLISLHPRRAVTAACALLNHAFSRVQADILVHVSPTHGTSNGNENPSSMLTKAPISQRVTLNDSPREIAFPQRLPPFAASRLSRVKVGPGSFRHSALASQAMR
jgi:hypothetical protein